MKIKVCSDVKHTPLCSFVEERVAFLCSNKIEGMGDNLMNFEESYGEFMQYHLKNRRGHALYQLKSDQGEAKKLFLQKVWWPAFNHFHYLSPEHEVFDYQDGKRYLDFAYLRPPIQICIEIDGFGPHWRNINPPKFADDRRRQNHLEVDGWMVIRFAYDDVVNHPRLCQQLVQQMIGRWTGENYAGVELNYIEKEIIRIAIRSCGVVTFQETYTHLEVSEKKARELLRKLADKDILSPVSGTKRVHAYKLNPNKLNRFF